jgi:hypothetical protein
MLIAKAVANAICNPKNTVEPIVVQWYHTSGTNHLTQSLSNTNLQSTGNCEIERGENSVPEQQFTTRVSGRKKRIPEKLNDDFLYEL